MWINVNKEQSRQNSPVWTIVMSKLIHLVLLYAVCASVTGNPLAWGMWPKESIPEPSGITTESDTPEDVIPKVPTEHGTEEPEIKLVDPFNPKEDGRDSEEPNPSGQGHDIGGDSAAEQGPKLHPSIFKDIPWPFQLPSPPEPTDTQIHAPTEDDGTHTDKEDKEGQPSNKDHKKDDEDETKKGWDDVKFTAEAYDDGNGKERKHREPSFIGKIFMQFWLLLSK